MRIMKFIIRTGMVFVVLLGIYLFLGAPQLLQSLRSQKSINILAWPNIIDSSKFKEFEKKTGIKVHLTYFENYEELIVKMQAGAGDYDLLMSSDYAVKLLKSYGVVKPIDKKKLTFWKHIYPNMLNLSFDPNNEYTIPYAWELYGIGINMHAFKHMPRASWDLLFDPAHAPARVGMLDDAREVISVAAHYLFGSQNDKQLSLEDLEKIKELLLKQKYWVAMYTDLRTDYLLMSQSAPVVMGISSDIYQAMRENENIKFLLPEEGSFMIVDNFMITASSHKDELIYEFLNYLYQPEVLGNYLEKYTFFPVRDQLVSKESSRYLITPTKSLFSRLSFFDYSIPEDAMRSLWIALKS